MSASEHIDRKSRSHRDEEQQFFMLVGMAVVRYQHAEDFLGEIFAAAWAPDDARASAIFKVAKGLEQKLALVSAALICSPNVVRQRWESLEPRIRKAAIVRNSIAHATTVFFGGGATVVVQPNGDITVTPNGDGAFGLRKRTKAGETVWKEPMLRAEVRRFYRLFSDLAAFRKEVAETDGHGFNTAAPA